MTLIIASRLTLRGKMPKCPEGLCVYVAQNDSKGSSTFHAKAAKLSEAIVKIGRHQCDKPLCRRHLRTATDLQHRSISIHAAQ